MAPSIVLTVEPHFMALKISLTQGKSVGKGTMKKDMAIAEEVAAWDF